MNSTLETEKIHGKDKILKALRGAEESSQTAHLEDEGLTFTQLFESTGLARSILSRYLEELFNKKQIEKTWRKYRITGTGKEVLEVKDDIAVISRTKRIVRKELAPNLETTVFPAMLPVEVSIYLNSEINKLVDTTKEDLLLTKGPPVSKDEALETLLSKIALPTSKYFDDMLVSRFMGLPGMDYRNQKIPQGGPKMAFQSLLDLEGAVLVRLSRDKLRIDQENIRNRFTVNLLNKVLGGKYEIPINTFTVMKELGMITSEECDKYEQARDPRSEKRVLSQLLKKYDALAWGERKRTRTPRDHISVEILDKRRAERKKKLEAKEESAHPRSV